MHIVVFSSGNFIHIMRLVSFWQKSNFSILNSFYNEICSCFKQLMFAKLLKSEIILSRCHYHIIPKGSKTSLNVYGMCDEHSIVHSHTDTYITTHSIYLSILCEVFFSVVDVRLTAVSLLSVAISHVALVALHSIWWCIFI